MIFLIAGASHTGKTVLAQKLLEQYHYPYLSIDHLKMGLIRSGQTTLTAEEDDQLTDYLWPIVREMIKTAIENKQHLIVEGCYIPYDFKKDFSGEYLAYIKYICLIFSDYYIEENYEKIISYGNTIENRLENPYSKDILRKDNKDALEKCKKYGCDYIMIDKSYDFSVDMDIVFSSERLYFRRITSKDFLELSKILKDPEVMYAWEHDFTDEDVYAWIEKRCAQYNMYGYDYFLAIDKSTKEVIGQIGLLDEIVDGKHLTGLGYIVKKEFWHRGFATEGAKAMLAYAFDTLGKKKVIAEIRPENTSSRNVAKRLGMRIESEFIKIYNGKRMPHLIYSIKKESI